LREKEEITMQMIIIKKIMKVDEADNDDDIITDNI